MRTGSPRTSSFSNEYFFIVIVVRYFAAESPNTRKRWERTQSEVYLKGKLHPSEEFESNLECAMSGSDQALSEHNVSEHTKVRQP